jgi:hypothetical protein
MNFSQIYEGWKNKLIPASDMKQQIEEVSRERLDVCSRCPHQSENRKASDKRFRTVRPDVHCTSCGCTLSAKTACLSCSCPKGFWKEVLSEDDAEQLKNDVDGKHED